LRKDYLGIEELQVNKHPPKRIHSGRIFPVSYLFSFSKPESVEDRKDNKIPKTNAHKNPSI
jgi:hypothetical protein